jgi:hypothetical protein
MECRHSLPKGKVLRALDEHLMLTKNLEHHLGPLQYHLQTLLDPSLGEGTKIGGDFYASQVFF